MKHLYTKVKVKADEHNVLLSYLKLGTYSYDKLTDLVWYIIPEVVILCLLMVNSIYLRLIGYKRLSELDIEDVTEGIERVIEKGDLEKVIINKILSYNFNLNHYFESRKT